MSDGCQTIAIVSGVTARGVLEERVEALERLLGTLHGLPARLSEQSSEQRDRRLLFRTACQSSRLTRHTLAKSRRWSERGAPAISSLATAIFVVSIVRTIRSRKHIKNRLKNEVTHERLAEMMLELQARGCHNINFVSPTHFAPQMARSILHRGRSKGLRLPIVYNTNAYDSVEVLRLLDRHR